MQNNCIVMVRNVLRFTPSFNAAKKFVSRGRLGNLHYAERTYFHDVEDMHRVVQETPWRVGKLNGVAKRFSLAEVSILRLSLTELVCRNR